MFVLDLNSTPRSERRPGRTFASSSLDTSRNPNTSDSLR